MFAGILARVVLDEFSPFSIPVATPPLTGVHTIGFESMIG